MSKKEYKDLKYEVKKGLELLWFLGGYIAFLMLGATIIFTKNIEYGFLISIISYTIIGSFVIIGIKEKFGSDYEVIRAYENAVLHSKKHQFENEYKWSDLTYTKIKKHHTIPMGKYRCRYLIKDVYSFYKDEKKLFNVSNIEDKSFIKFIEELIATNVLKEKKVIFNCEEVLEIKPDKSKKMSLDIEMYGVMAFWLILLFAALFAPFNGMWTLLLLYTIALLFQYRYFKHEYEQLKQKMYVVKDKGFYIVKNEQNVFYKFNEIDKAETECYLVPESVDNKLRIYKDNQELIILTNLSDGFYDFIDILKERRIIKEN